MSDLSPQLEELVIAGRKAARPTEGDFERVLGLLEGRLGPSALGGELAAAPNTAGLTRLLSGKAIAITTAGVALMAGSIGWYRSHTRHETAGFRQQPAVALPVAYQAPVSTAPIVQDVQEQRPVAPPVGPSASSAKSGPTPSAREAGRARDSLSEEVAILSRAGTELHSGRAESALRTLNEHERKFPHGILTEERIAARIQALCALGRVGEANALLARLRPGSLHGETSRQACAPATPPAR